MKHKQNSILSLVLTVLLALTTLMITGAAAQEAAAVNVSFHQAVTAAGEAYPNLLLYSLSLEDENGFSLYQAELYNPADGTVVEVGIDSTTGEMIEKAADEDYQDEDGGNSYENETEADTEYESEDVTENDTETGKEDAALAAQVKLTVAQVEELVASTNPNAVILSIDLENENGQPVYEVLFTAETGQKMSLTIDAVSGAFLAGDEQEVNG